MAGVACWAQLGGGPVRQGEARAEDGRGRQVWPTGAGQWIRAQHRGLLSVAMGTVPCRLSAGSGEEGHPTAPGAWGGRQCAGQETGEATVRPAGRPEPWEEGTPLRTGGSKAWWPDTDGREPRGQGEDRAATQRAWSRAQGAERCQMCCSVVISKTCQLRAAGVCRGTQRPWHRGRRQLLWG